MSPDILQKPEGVSETPAQKAEKLLLNLRKKMESAVTTEEKKKYSSLVSRLEESLADKTAAAKEGTKDILAHFRSGLSPDQKSLLESAEKNTITATEKGKNLVLDATEQAKKSLESGDISKGTQMVEDAAKKAVAVAGVSVGAAGIWEVIRQAADGIMKPLKALSDMIGEMFKMLFGPIINMFKGIWDKISGGFKNLKGDLSQKENGEQEKEITMSPEDREKARENMVENTKEYISQKFLYGENLSDGKLRDMKKIISEHEFPTEALQKFLEKTKDRVTILDGVDLVESTVFNHAGLVLKLALAGCIPMKRLAISLVEGQVQSSKTHFALTLDGVGIPPSYIGMDEMQKIADQYKDDPKMRANYLYLMYKPASILSSIAGSIIGNMASFAIGISTETIAGKEVDTFKMAKDVWKGHNTAQYDELIKNFSLLESKLGVEAGKGAKFAEGLRNLQSLTGYMRNNYILLECLEKHKGNAAEFAKDTRVASLLSSSDMAHLSKVGSEEELREFVRKTMMKWEGTLGLIESVKRWSSWLSGSWNARIFEQAEKLNDMLNLQSRLAIKDPAVLRWYRSLEEVKKYATISRVQDTTFLMVKDEQALRELTPALAKLGAEGVKHLFNGLPMIGLYVGARDLLNNEKERTSMGAWLKNITAALSMPIGGIVLMNEAAVVKKDDGSYGVENMQQGLIGASLFAGGVWYSFAGGTVREGVMRASGIRTIVQAGEVVTAGVRGVNTTWRVAGKVSPKLGESVARALQVIEKTPWRIKTKIAIAGWSALAIALTIALKNSSDPYEDAVKEWFIDVQTGKLTAKFDGEFAKQSIEKKKEMLDAVAFAWYKSEWVENPVTAYEGGWYEVYAQNIMEAKKLQRAVNQFSDDFAGHTVTIVETAIENKKTV